MRTKTAESLEVDRLWNFANDARAVDLYLQQLGTKIKHVNPSPRAISMNDKKKLLVLKYSFALKDIRSKLVKISICTCGHNANLHAKRMCACGHSKDAHTYTYHDYNYREKETYGPCGYCNCVHRIFSVSPQCKKCSCTEPKYSVIITLQRNIYLDQINEIEKLLVAFL